jgi:hypothetical protein
MNLHDIADAELSILRIKALEFHDSKLWPALRDNIEQEHTRISADLVNRDTPGDKLKFAQGELAQANRDILLVERFLNAIDREQSRRRKAEERR